VSVRSHISNSNMGANLSDVSNTGGGIRNSGGNPESCDDFLHPPSRFDSYDFTMDCL